MKNSPLEMIAEWRGGCSVAPTKPEECPECTLALINALEKALTGRKIDWSYSKEEKDRLNQLQKWGMLDERPEQVDTKLT